MLDEHDKKLTTSKVLGNIEMSSGILLVLQVAARYGVSQTLLSRILLASVVMGRHFASHVTYIILNFTVLVMYDQCILGGE